MSGSRTPRKSFQAELVQQATKLHYGHTGLPMDTRLVGPTHPSDPADDPDFVSHMPRAMPPPLELLVVGGALASFHDLLQVVDKGSLATSLEELPRPLVGALPRYALLGLAQVPRALSEEVPGRVLIAVLHLYLAGVAGPTADRSY